jgi:hypothetical protein
MTDDIPDSATIARNEWVLFSDTGNGVSLMDIDSGNYYHFEKTSARIWELLDKPATLDSLCERLVAEFEVDLDTCRSETAQFIAELREKRLVDLQVK